MIQQGELRLRIGRPGFEPTLSSGDELCEIGRSHNPWKPQWPHLRTSGGRVGEEVKNPNDIIEFGGSNETVKCLSNVRH